MTMYIDVQLGQVAMAQGRVRDAEAYYRRAQRVANNNYVLAAVPAAICGVLLQELALECNRAAPGAELARVPEALTTGSSPFSAFAAASGAVVELRLRDEGVDGALTAADEMLDYVREARLPALARHLSALRVSLLAVAGRIGDGEEVWGRCHVNLHLASLWAPTPELMQRSSLAATVSSRRRGIGGVFGGRPDGVGR